jgi:hypothetical protein
VRTGPTRTFAASSSTNSFSVLSRKGQRALQRDSHGSASSYKPFVVVEETAELLAATIVYPQPVSAAGRGSREIPAERGFIASAAAIDALRRTRVWFESESAFLRTYCHVPTERFFRIS